MKTALTADFWPSSHLQINFSWVPTHSSAEAGSPLAMISSSTLHEVIAGKISRATNCIALCTSFGLERREGLLKIENRYFRGDGGIGAAPRLAAAHRGADTNVP